MTTYERGKEPQGAMVVWEYVVHEGCEIVLDSGEILRGLHASDADAICRAFHVAKLAEEYAKAKAAMDAAATYAEIESVRSAYYDAARALCEAVR